MDGVLVDTAHFHYSAWKRLAQELGFDFTLAQNEALKGVSRTRSLDILLDFGGIKLDEQAKIQLCDQKNHWYVDSLQSITPQALLPGAREALLFCKRQHIGTALGSASKNARLILNLTGLTDLFDAIIDGHATSDAKPDPAVFLLGAQALKFNPEDCLVFEDSEAGILAARAAKMGVIGIGAVEQLSGADQVYPDLSAFLGTYSCTP